MEGQSGASSAAALRTRRLPNGKHRNLPFEKRPSSVMISLLTDGAGQDAGTNRRAVDDPCVLTGPITNDRCCICAQCENNFRSLSTWLPFT